MSSGSSAAVSVAALQYTASQVESEVSQACIGMAAAAAAALVDARRRAAQEESPTVGISKLVDAIAAADAAVASTADAASAAALGGPAPCADPSILSEDAQLLRSAMVGALQLCCERRLSLHKAQGRGDYPRALDEAARALALSAPDGPERRKSWVNVASALVALGRHTPALRAAVRACQLDERTFSPDGPLADMALNPVSPAISGIIADSLIASVRDAGASRHELLVADELSCAQCLAIVHQPVTLGDGVTVCMPCVGKYRRAAAAAAQPGASGHAACRLFGGSVNVLLQSTVQRVLPAAVAAAAARHDGNDHFRGKRWTEAVECYTRGIEHGYDEHVLYANRSAARLSAGQPAEAKVDADFAIAAKPGWARGFFRRGRALIALHAQLQASAEAEAEAEAEPDAEAEAGAETRDRKGSNKREREHEQGSQETRRSRAKHAEGGGEAEAAMAAVVDAGGLERLIGGVSDLSIAIGMSPGEELGGRPALIKALGQLLEHTTCSDGVDAYDRT